MKIILICLISMAIFSSSALAVSPLSENVDIDLLLEKALESYNNLKLDDALFYLDEILKHDPDNVFALNNKGGVLMQLEKYDDALLYFEKAIEINPDFVEAINNKATALNKLDRNVDALSTFYEAYKIDPNDKIIAENMASINDVMPVVMENSYAIIEGRTFDDQLIGVTISQNLGFKQPLALLFLEDNAEWKPIEIDGEKFESLEYSTSFPILEQGLGATSKISLIEKDATYGVYVIDIMHNGFLIQSGDKWNVKIVLLRPS